MRSTNRRYLYPVDHIRFAAATLVILYHGTQLISQSIQRRQHLAVPAWLYSRNPVKTVVFEGHTGVALFMVLSGYIFTVGTLDHDLYYGRFMANRLLRIYPLYLLLAFIGMTATHGSFTLQNLAIVIFPLSSFGPVAVGGAWGAMFWAVAIEMQFYLIFPLLLRLLNRAGPVVLLRIIAALFVLRVLTYLVSPNTVDINGITYYSILGRLDQFLLGMIAAWVYIRRPAWFGRPTLVISAILAIIMLWAFNQAHGFANPAAWRMGWVDVEGVVWAVFIGSYVMAFRDRTGGGSRLLARLGEISYSSYLLHFVIVTWIASKANLQVSVGGPVTTAFVTTVVVVLPITVGLAFITYQGIERPFLELRLKYIKDPVPARAITVDDSALPADPFARHRSN